MSPIFSLFSFFFLCITYHSTCHACLPGLVALLYPLLILAVTCSFLGNITHSLPSKMRALCRILGSNRVLDHPLEVLGLSALDGTDLRSPQFHWLRRLHYNVCFPATQVLLRYRLCLPNYEPNHDRTRYLYPSTCLRVLSCTEHMIYMRPLPTAHTLPAFFPSYLPLDCPWSPPSPFLSITWSAFPLLLSHLLPCFKLTYYPFVRITGHFFSHALITQAKVRLSITC